MQIVGDHLPPMPQQPYGDIRDVIVAAPNWGGHGYALMDLFTVRWEIIRALDPQPASVFEFGTLLGYFLLTAIDASPTIRKVGWIDTELDFPGSNELADENVRDLFEKQGRPYDPLFWDETTRNCRTFSHADLVQVDGAHTYADCITDLFWARELTPRTIFVDDYLALDEVKLATNDFAQFFELPVEVYETVNGLAVLRLP
jgi:hypothetical protein